jgi:alkane 1-monooxygenase
VLRVGLVLAFGPVLIPLLLVHDFLAWWSLTSANYIEHYALLRTQGADGKYENPKPHHSWNSNHVVSNLISFHLERHSDHHAHPTRRYQALRHFDELPTLPGGYTVMFLLAYLPAALVFRADESPRSRWSAATPSACVNLGRAPPRLAEPFARAGGG